MTTLKLIAPLLRTAIQAADSLPPNERADVYDGVAYITGELDPVMARQASELATAIRESEALQLHFRNLFTK